MPPSLHWSSLAAISLLLLWPACHVSSEDQNVCSDNQFQCRAEHPAETRCIFKNQTCDGKGDCPALDDEDGCPFTCTGDYHFKCGDGDCVDKHFRCDGDADCADKSDEVGCEAETEKKTIECEKDEKLICDLCLPHLWLCDGEKDCPDGSDEEEENCKLEKETKTPKINFCTEDTFKCNDGLCIPKRWRCDGSADCADRSDEEGCVAEDCHSELGQFLCADKSACLKSPKQVCNGHKDCDDGSDEGGECDTECDASRGCSHNCMATPTGPRCHCPSGFALDFDDTHSQCTDVDECAVGANNTCDQKCENHDGGFECHCQLGYNRKDGACRALGGEAMLLFATKSQIRAFQYDRGAATLEQLEATDVHSSPHANTVEVAFDSSFGRVLWTQAAAGVEGIYWKSLHEPFSQVKTLLKDPAIRNPEGLAIDHLGRNVYFTNTKDEHEAGNSFIGVASLYGDHSWTKVVEMSVEKPRGIALYPERGLLFYSDWGSRPALMRVDMDGRNQKVLVSEKLEWINGVAIDKGQDRVFWSDAKHDVIESVTIDGLDRRTVLENVRQHPFSLAVFEDRLFFTDWQDKELVSCNKLDGREFKVMYKHVVEYPMGVSAWHPVLEGHPVDGGWCQRSFCSHLCLLGPDGGTCACPIGWTLGADTVTCLEPITTTTATSPAPAIDGRVGGQGSFSASSSASPSSSSSAATSSSSTKTFPTQAPITDDAQITPSTSAPFTTNAETTALPTGRKHNDATQKQGTDENNRNESSSSSSPESQFGGDDDDEVTKERLDTEPSSSEAGAKAAAIVTVIALLVMVAVGLFCVVRKRNAAANVPISMHFRNPNFRRVRLSTTNGAEELKDVVVSPASAKVDFSHNELHNPAFPPLAHASSADSLKPPKDSDAGRLRRNMTNPKDMQHQTSHAMVHDQLQHFSLDSPKSEGRGGGIGSSNLGSTPVGASDLDDEDDGGYTAYGDEVNLLP